MRITSALLALATVVTPGIARADESVQSALEIEKVQAMLAVQDLDGWLLWDFRGQNPLARELVAPTGQPTRQWFYLIPAAGQPVMLVHRSEAAAFDRVAGTKIEYSGHRDLADGLRTLLTGKRKVAMEYDPKSGIPSLTRVDSGTVASVTRTGVKVMSSAQLVQQTKSLWGPDGRVAHYVAAHHMTVLFREAGQLIDKRLRQRERITDEDVVVFLLRGFKVRGLTGQRPVVAVGASAAEPAFSNRKGDAREIKGGDLILIDLRASVSGMKRPVFANLSWIYFAGDRVPERVQSAFASVASARDAALTLIRDRIERRRPVRGYEVDQEARKILGSAGLADRFVHRTGHSLDTELYGDGANLDDYETHDTRNLVVGSGFTVGPGVYFKDDFGLRSVIDIYIARAGVEVTAPVQKQITLVGGSGP